MVEFAQNTAVNGPGLQSDAAPPSLDTRATTGQSAIEAHELTRELSAQYGLTSETSQQLGDILATASPEARANLVDALQNDRLSTEDRAAIIDSLHDIRFETRRSELNNPNAQQALLESTIERIADNYSGHQSDRRTCSVTTSQTRLAEDPVTYTQLVAGLTSPAGEFQLESGATIHYVENSHLEDRSLNGNSTIVSRPIETRIVQSALMQFGAGYETTANGELAMRYDAQRDVFVDNVNGGETSGMYPDWMQRMNINLFNEGSQRLDTANVTGVDTPPGQVIDAMQESLNRNGIDITAEISTSNNLNDPHSMHIVQVTEIRDGRVYFFNGWNSFHQLTPSHQSEMTENGRIESMSVEDFQAQLRSAYIPQPGVTAANAQLTELQTSRTYLPDNPDSLNPHIAPPSVTYQQPEAASQDRNTSGASTVVAPITLEESEDSLRDASANISGRGPNALAAASAIRQLLPRDDEADLFKS